MTIEIVSFEQVDNFVLDYLKDNLVEIFGAEVHMAKTLPLPEYAYDKKRGQYHSSVILQQLLKLKKGQTQRILAVIDKDLYVPGLNFVFGEADLKNGICIISLIRLRQSYYGLKEDKDLFLKRALKEAVHEIGHLLNKDYHFCDKCKKSLP